MTFTPFTGKSLIERIQQQDAVDHAILYGDDMDVLQALGDPGDGDLADYL